MNKRKSYFEMHARFRNGIFLLTLLTLFLIGVFYLFFQKEENTNNNFIELSDYQCQIDSLVLVEKSKRREYIAKPFNPNFITDYKGYVLGISEEEMDRLSEFRKQNKWINSVGHFKKVTGVSDSLLEIISPLFKFPNWVANSRKRNNKKKVAVRTFDQKNDINKVTSVELQNEIGIPDFIADRIIKYRKGIEGFVADIQLKDVRGLYDKQRKEIMSLYTVKTEQKIIKLNINQASVKELMTVPYFDFETAIEIKDFIVDHNGVSSFEELGKIEGFSVEKIDRIALYLKLN